MLLAAIASTVALQYVLTWFQQVFMARLGTALTVTGSADFLWHILNLPVDFYNQRYAGDVSSRVELNDKVAQLLSGPLATAVFNLVMILFYVPVMLMYEVKLTFFAIGLALINGCLLYTSPSPRDLSTSRMPSSA